MKIYHIISSVTSISLMLSLSNCGKSEDKAAEAPKPEAPKTEAPKPAAPKPAAPAPVAAAPAAPAPAPAPATPAKLDEKAAIAKFQAELKATKAAAESIMKEGDKAAAENPMAALVPMKTLCAKMQEIRGEGLPADLKEAWLGVSASFAKMSELFKDFPDKPADMTAWLVKTVGTDPAALQKWQTDFQTKLGEAGQGTEVAGKKFAEVGAKYGIDPELLK